MNDTRLELALCTRRASLVIGLDCAPPALLFDRWRSELPTIRSLLERGRRGVLRAFVAPTILRLRGEPVPNEMEGTAIV